MNDGVGVRQAEAGAGRGRMALWIVASGIGLEDEILTGFMI